MCSLFGFFGMPGGTELIIVAFVILLLFGNRLPSVMRSLGQGITEFKKGVKGVTDDFDSATKIEDDNEKH
jgi:sec-independent protein translocase protein TatA